MPITTTQTASQFRSEDYLIVIKGLMYDVMQDNSKVDQVSQRVAMVRYAIQFKTCLSTTFFYIYFFSLDINQTQFLCRVDRSSRFDRVVG